jgi:sigma-B regulation protein RsbU (phosphoserine phosphatase)
METQFNILYGQPEMVSQDLARVIFEEMKFLHQISLKLSEKMPLARLLYEIMENSKLVVEAEASSLLLYEPGEKKLYFQAVTGDKADIVKKFSLKLGQGIAGWVAKHKQPLLIEDCYQDPRFNQDFDRSTNFRTRSMICVPLLRNNKLLGVVQVINKKGKDSFSQRDLIIFETLASQCAIAIENARLVEAQVASEALKNELEKAREIQQQLLPAVLPDYQDLDVAAKLAPAEHVGGDYYNVIRLDAERSLFMVADVTGKGIPAALLVSTVHSALLTYLKMHLSKINLLKLVSALNRVLIDCTGGSRFVTCWFGLYHHSTRTLTSVNAGHNFPYLFSKETSSPRKLTEGGLFLGIMDRPYTSETIQLYPDDMVVFYSDGVTEAENTRKELFGEPRLIETVASIQTTSAQTVLNTIMQDIKKHVGRAKPSDDITCGIIRVGVKA